MKSSGDLLLQYLRYNLWANKVLCKVLETIDQSWLDKELRSSFPTIRKTAFHIWDAEYVWLSRLKGVSPTAFPSKDFGSDVHPSRFSEGAKAFLDFVEAQNEDFFSGETSYATTKGEKFSDSNSNIIFHIMNHGTFHRGQLITMIRAAGHEGSLPSTDMITYLRELSH